MENIPHHIASQCSDVQFRMLHIKHPNKHQEYFEIFRKLKHNEIFTDVTFITKTGKSLSVHRSILAAYSDLFKNIFSEAFDLHYKVLLPDIDYSDVEALCHILYGVDVAVPRSRFDKIHTLADMFGIPVSKLRTPEDFLLDPNEPRLAASQAAAASAASVASAASRDNPRVSGETLPPLCCWHCNRTFVSLKEFQTHLDTKHKGQAFKSKRHKCTKCKKVSDSLKVFPFQTNFLNT